MPFVKAQCPNCGGVLDVDQEKDAAICQFCNTAFIVEKAINNYTTNNHYAIQNAEINIVGEDVNQLVADAEFFLGQGKDIENATRRFETLAQKYPRDYRAWLGLIRCYTKDFSDVSVSSEVIQKADSCYSKFEMLSPEDVKIDINKKYYTFKKKRDYNRQIIDIKAQISQAYSERDEVRWIGTILWAIIGILIFVLIVVSNKVSSNSIIGGIGTSLPALCVSIIMFAKNKKIISQTNQKIAFLNTHLERLKKEYQALQ